MLLPVYAAMRMLILPALCSLPDSMCCLLIKTSICYVAAVLLLCFPSASHQLYLLQANPCATSRFADAYVRNRLEREVGLLLYLYQMDGASIVFCLVACIAVLYMPASCTGLQTIQTMPSIGTTYVCRPCICVVLCK